jgi:hypothetical protein
MTSVPTDPTTDQQTLLFYRKPAPLFATSHGDMALKRGMGFGFTAETNAVPVMVSEFADLSRFYPIVFAGRTPLPCVVLGLDRTNLFVDADGQWRERHYIPAYVRRYPFVFFATEADGKFALGIDEACEQLVEADKADGADRLFIDGKPSSLTADALRFSSTMQTDQLATAAFAAALQKHDLLVPRQADVALSSGRRLSVPGFFCVEAGRFQALPDAVIVDWHRKGWLALVHRHLDSLARWTELLEPQATQDRASQATAEVKN